MSYEMIAICAVCFLVLITLYCIVELVNQKKACATIIKELNKYSQLAKQRKTKIEILETALGHATKGKCRHPEKGYFIGKEEFYAYFNLKE